ncbi:hypothetical protein AAG570_011567 [Ranatra chinensis]|uniref:PKD/REJ-like domain-containing protein n=1 Tax=Ranatra chinensis TaxID=642074 RepID=A0ABD0YL02_9HEMI
MASKRRNMFQKNKTQETTENDTSGNKITSLTLETNDRPQKGSCQIDPPNGTVLMTEFNIKCSGFKDRDEVTVSLLYELYEIKSDTPTDTLLAYSYKPYFKGIRLTSSNIKIRVTDMYGLYPDCRTENGRQRVNKINRYELVDLARCDLQSTPLHANLDDEKIEEVLNSISRTILEDGDQSLAVQQIVGVVNSVTTLQNKESLVDNLIEKLTQLNEYVIKDVLQVSTAADKLLTRTVREEKDGLTTHSIMAVGSLLKKISGSFLAEALVEKHITMKDIKTVSTCIFNCIEKVIVSRDKSLTEPFADPEVYETNFYQVQKGTEGMIKALDNIADSLISVIVTAESDIGVQSGSMSMRSLVETPEQLSASNGFVVGNSIFKMDKELAEHYKGQKLGVTMVSMDKDPMWWDPEKPKINSNVAFVKLNLMEGGKTKPIRQLPSPFDLILKVEDKMTAPQIIKGEVEKAPEEMSLYDKDTYVAIHRIEVDDDFEGELTIEFENISPANELRALVLNDKNPDYILVAKGQIITSASSVIKQTISRKDENSFFYLGIIPAEKFATGQKISYTFKVKHKMCKTWDGKRWKSESCMVSIYTEKHILLK